MSPNQLALSFSLTSTYRSRTRLYALALTDNVRLLTSPTEALPSNPAPARYATTAVIPADVSELTLQLLVGNITRASTPVSVPSLLNAVRDTTALHVPMLNDTISVEVHAEYFEPELATHQLSFSVASHGVVNAFCAGLAPDCEIVVSRRRSDGTWQCMYRRLRRVQSGGSLLLRCSDDCSDVVLRVEAFAVKGVKREKHGECMCSLKWLRERQVGERIPFREDGKRKGYMVMVEVEDGKAESKFEVEAYLYGRCGPDVGDMAMVMAHDAEGSVPNGTGTRVEAVDLEKIGREGRRRGDGWIRSLWRVVRMRNRRDDINDFVLGTVRGVGQGRRDETGTEDGEGVVVRRERSSRF